MKRFLLIDSVPRCLIGFVPFETIKQDCECKGGSRQSFLLGSLLIIFLRSTASEKGHSYMFRLEKGSGRPSNLRWQCQPNIERLHFDSWCYYTTFELLTDNVNGRGREGAIY